MKRLFISTFAICMSLMLLIPATALAESTESLITIGETTIDTEELAEKNGVNQYELKAAIQKGLSEEKASPFSNLVTTNRKVPNSNISTQIVQPYASIKTAYKMNQDSTAYVSQPGALTASGKTPTIGMCAMHINVTTKTGSTTENVVKLGTTIFMEEAIDINGTDYPYLVVEDRGNPSNRTPYWIDVYFGLTDTYYGAAINYGITPVSYHYFYQTND